MHAGANLAIRVVLRRHPPAQPKAAIGGACMRHDCNCVYACRRAGGSDLGQVMLVVDQPGSLSSLLLAIADDIGVDTGF